MRRVRRAECDVVHGALRSAPALCGACCALRALRVAALRAVRAVQCALRVGGVRCALHAVRCACVVRACAVWSAGGEY